MQPPTVRTTNPAPQPRHEAAPCEPSAFERGESGVTIGRPFASDRTLKPDEKFLLILMHGVADDSGVCWADSLTLADLAGIADEDGNLNRQQVQRLQRRLAEAGRLAKHPGARGIYCVCGTRPGDRLKTSPKPLPALADDAELADATAYLESLVTRPESSASRMMRARSGIAEPPIGFGPAPRRLTPDELAEFDRLVAAAVQRRHTRERYPAIRYALERMYPDGDGPFSAYHGVEAMTHSWRRGVRGLQGRDQRIAVELFRAGVILRRMEGF